MAVSPTPLLLFLLLTATTTASADSSSDSAALLKFKSSIKGAAANDAFSTWSESSPPCSGDISNWAHVRCSKGSVQSIILENLALAGDIDVDSLAGVSSLRTFSLIKNNFEGPLPAVHKLSYLKSVFLSDNKFSGEIPDDAFKGMQSLKKLHLARNGFTGKIPTSLTQLPKLLELRLEGNKFFGQIPDFQQKQLLLVDVSGNNLEGRIPATLAKMNSSFFSSNKGLCGAPLPECSEASTNNAAADEKKSNGTSSSSGRIGIVIGGVVGALLLLGAAIGFVLCLRKRDDSSLRAIEANPTPSNLRRKASFKEETPSRRGSPARSSGARRAEAMKLSFLREEEHKFDLQDLLKASAEILGSGCFGSSYKTALTTGTVMVVKRFRQMNNVDKDEFQEHMRRLGRLTHPNLLPIVAYYYRKEEKLLVTHFVNNGSLAVHLHSKVHPALDWASRLKIIKGVTNGLVYLYNELPSLIAPHGHLKSSNVLLNDSNEPLITDYGLIPVINQESAQDLMVAYKSPEYLQSTRVTKKTDVWNLGILILEILTGKFPANFLKKAGQAADQDQDLADWVSSVGPTPEVLDKEMKASSNCEKEMVKMLKIGLACCEADLEKRLDMKEVAEKIEEVREKDGDESGFFSSRPSDAGGDGSGTN